MHDARPPAATRTARSVCRFDTDAPRHVRLRVLESARYALDAQRPQNDRPGLRPGRVLRGTIRRRVRVVAARQEPLTPAAAFLFACSGISSLALISWRPRTS